MTRLSELYGQTSAIGALRRAMEAGQLPGTYLLVGTPGIGKGAMAQAIAQCAACLTPCSHPFDACGTCESCRRAQAGTHPDILTIAPAGETMQIWQFWDREGRSTPGALSRTLAFAPTVGKRRVYILEPADALTESAANSLLKALEEPPPYALFILTAPHASRVLPTIVSRSSMIRLHPIPTEALAQYLQTEFNVDATRAGLLAAYSEGRIGQAVRLAQNSGASDEIARVLDFAEELAAAPRVRALRLAETMRKLSGQVKALLGENTEASGGGINAPDDESSSGATGKEKTGRRQLAAVFDLLVAFYRDLLALSVSGPSAPGIVNRDRIAALARLAPSAPPARWMRCLDALLLARRRLDANANIALVTEILAMTLLA